MIFHGVQICIHTLLNAQLIFLLTSKLTADPSEVLVSNYFLTKRFSCFVTWFMRMFHSREICSQSVLLPLFLDDGFNHTDVDIEFINDHLRFYSKIMIVIYHFLDFLRELLCFCHYENLSILQPKSQCSLKVDKLF